MILKQKNRNAMKTFNHLIIVIIFAIFFYTNTKAQQADLTVSVGYLMSTMKIMNQDFPHGTKGVKAIPTPAAANNIKKSRLDRVFLSTEPCADIYYHYGRFEF